MFTPPCKPPVLQGGLMSGLPVNATLKAKIMVVLTGREQPAHESPSYQCADPTGAPATAAICWVHKSVIFLADLRKIPFAHNKYSINKVYSLGRSAKKFPDLQGPPAQLCSVNTRKDVGEGMGRQ